MNVPAALNLLLQFVKSQGEFDLSRQIKRESWSTTMAVCPKPAESRTCLSGLPAEILVSIAECCRARTVLSLIGTCWRLHGILNNGHVWKQVLRSQHWQRWGPSSRFDLTKLSHAIRAASESHTAPPADFLATKLWARYALADDDAWVVLGKADQDLEAALRSLVRIAMPLAVFGRKYIYLPLWNEEPEHVYSMHT